MSQIFVSGRSLWKTSKGLAENPDDEVFHWGGNYSFNTTPDYPIPLPCCLQPPKDSYDDPNDPELVYYVRRADIIKKLHERTVSSAEKRPIEQPLRLVNLVDPPNLFRLGCEGIRRKNPQNGCQDVGDKIEVDLTELGVHVSFSPDGAIKWAKDNLNLREAIYRATKVPYQKTIK